MSNAGERTSFGFTIREEDYMNGKNKKSTYSVQEKFDFQNG